MGEFGDAYKRGRAAFKQEKEDVTAAEKKKAVETQEAFARARLQLREAVSARLAEAQEDLKRENVRMRVSEHEIDFNLSLAGKLRIVLGEPHPCIDVRLDVPGRSLDYPVHGLFIEPESGDVFSFKRADPPLRGEAIGNVKGLSPTKLDLWLKSLIDGFARAVSEADLK